MKRIIVFTLITVLISCTDTSVPLPKPRIYPRVVFPEKSYQEFKSDVCPFKMSVPTYFKYKEDNQKINNEKNYECWFDLYSEELNCYLHFSYLPFDNRKEFDGLVQDAFEMADKHNVKASFRDELKVNIPNHNVYGLIFNIDGPVASPTQFFLTDSTQHFLRGSLYFNDVVNRDSIAPVYKFIQEDLAKLIDAFEWR